MSEEQFDVERQYEQAEIAVKDYNPGIQPDIGKLMRSAYIHGYARALIDFPNGLPEPQETKHG